HQGKSRALTPALRADPLPQAGEGNASARGLRRVPAMAISAPDVEAFAAYQRHHVFGVAEVEVARDTVLQAGRGMAERQALRIVESGEQAVQHAGGEGVAAADAVDHARQHAFRDTV